MDKSLSVVEGEKTSKLLQADCHAGIGGDNPAAYFHFDPPGPRCAIDWSVMRGRVVVDVPDDSASAEQERGAA